MQRKPWKLWRSWKSWGIGIAAVVCGAGVLWFAGQDRDGELRQVAVSGQTGSAPVAAPRENPTPRAKMLHDLGLLQLPAGAEVAVVEFDDLECPSCAHAMPIVHAAAARFGVPLVHHDFPLTEIHVWSFDAAVTARYLQDKISLQAADEFRRDVFANQAQIAGKDDLTQFTGRWFQAHALLRPFVMDADGSCENEVRADRALGDRMGIAQHGTPCIFVVTKTSATVVDDLTQLDLAIQTGLGQAAEVPRGTERLAKPV